MGNYSIKAAKCASKCTALSIYLQDECKYLHTHNFMFIILCMCHAHYMHVFVVQRKFLIWKLENQLLSRQIEAIKLHFLDDYLMKIIFPLFRFVYLYMLNKITLDV